MPPKVKFTKESIIKTSLELVRKNGTDALTARNISSALGSSPQPLFSYFKDMIDLKNEVFKAAEQLYSSYISEGLKENIPFKGAGIAYIRFADEEPQLFNMLFMNENGKGVVKHFLPKNDVNYEDVIAALERSWCVDREKAEMVYNHMAVYTHGLAVLFAQKTEIFTIKEAELMMTDIFRKLMEGEKCNLL